MGEALQEDWKIFSKELSQQNIPDMMQAVCGKNADQRIFHEKAGIFGMMDEEFRRNSCIMLDSTWEQFCQKIRKCSRFHPGCINLKTGKALFESRTLQMQIQARDHKKFYRGRIQNHDRVPYATDQMGPPPAAKAAPGRANAVGIPCLYPASDRNTTLHEIRARDLDDISIGLFPAEKDCSLIDLTGISKISPFSETDFSPDWSAVNLKVLEQIGDDIAKSIHRWDEEREYFPAQYIVDFIRSLG